MLRITVDTNIYISALNFGGLPEELLRMADAGVVKLVISPAILDEVARVLRGEKFAWPEEEIGKALRLLARLAERVEPAHRVDVIASDPSDNRILECADAGRADFVVSGDKHLLTLKRHGQAPILKVGDLLRQIQGEAEKMAT